jgi:allantoin racemase
MTASRAALPGAGIRKVLVIVPFPMTGAELAQREQQLVDVDTATDIVFHFRPVRAAPANYVSEHDSVIADVSILDAGMSAQEEGYDAVCIDTMSDSGLSALRSILDIPVIAPGRASMLTALMLGERFSILMMWDRWRHLYRKTIAELGFEWRCASIRSIDVTPNNRSLLAGKEQEVFPLLLGTAQRCVDEDGAEVILLGSTTMHQAHAYLARHLAVPVINPGPLTYKLCEAALALRVSHSRKTFPAPLLRKTAMVERMLAAAASPKGA